jgi:hypothetical protein
LAKEANECRPGDELNCEGDVLTLLCDDHHRLMDRGDVARLPEESLLAVKAEQRSPLSAALGSRRK